MGSIEFVILGQKYIIKGDADPAHIKEMADFVNEKLKEVYHRSPTITPMKAAILAALSIAEELHQMKREYSAITQGIRNIEDKADTILGLFD